MMIGKNLINLASRKASSYHYGRGGALKVSRVCRLPYTTTSARSDLSKYYKVEVSNAARADATKITVVGPDVDGILASMTVTLAREGCSLKELHAGYVDLSEARSHKIHVEGDQIEDIFFVANHETGEQFQDEALQDLGESLLKSLANPMTCLSGKGDSVVSNLNEELEPSKDEQITVVKRTTG